MSDIRSFFKPSQKGAKKEVKKEEKEEKESFEKEQEKEKKQQLQEKKRKAKKKPAFASTAPKVTTTPPKEKSLKRVEREDNEEDFLERPRKRPRKMNDNEDDDFLIEDADLAFSSGSGKKVKKPSPSPSEKKSSPRKLPLTITKAKGDDEKEEWIEKDPLPKETNLKPQPKPQLKSQPKSQPKSKENEEKKENLGDKQMSGYRSFMSRGAPPLKGSKNVDIEGKPYCLYNYHFLVTGVLESLEREDIHELITKYGGKVCKSLTKKCTHIVIGSDPGQAKIAQLEKRSDIVQLKGEDAFLELIRTNPGKSLSRSEKEALTPKIKIQKLTAPPPKKSSNSSSLSSSSSSSSSSAPQRSYSSLPNPHPASPTSPFRPPPSPSSPAPFSPSSPSPFSPSSPSSPSPLSLSSSLTSEPPVDDRLWTEKWRPRKLSDLVANKTAATNLQGWLKKWTNSSPKKAALIGGNPGIGKTSMAMVVCETLGLQAVCFNASDTRNKSSLRDQVSQVTVSHNLSEYYAPKSDSSFGGSGLGPQKSVKNVLIMDEVDGMSSGDRGGMVELYQLIKKTEIPIICICNDKSSPKMKTLKNYCLDLEFRKPTTTQVLPRVLSVAQAEGLSISTKSAEMLIESSRGDLRHVLNSLQLIRRNSSSVDHATIKKKIDDSHKDLTAGPFDVAPKLLSWHAGPLDRKIDMYFIDPNLIPLMIQDSYLNIIPALPAGPRPKQDLARIERVAKAAKCVSDGVLFDNAIHANMQWALSPAHAVASSILPAKLMSGRVGSQIYFPKWLGQYSTARKWTSLLHQLQVHTMEKTSGTDIEMCLSYAPALSVRLVKPLEDKGEGAVDEIVEFMGQYGITKEDRDAVFFFDTFKCLKKGGKEDSLPSNLKSKLTRAYNSSQYAAHALGKITRTMSEPESSLEESAQLVDEPEEEENDDLKGVFSPKGKGRGRGKGRATGSRGRGKATGRGAGKVKRK